MTAAHVQSSRQLFVDTRNIGCMYCKATKAEWAATGFSKIHGHWALCKPCRKEVRARKRVVTLEGDAQTS